jgi:hypothetical protein
MNLNKTILAGSVLLLASSGASAAETGMISNILAQVTTWAGAGQTAALAVSGLLGLVMFVGGIIAFKGGQQTQTTKGMAAVSVLIGLVLMYAAYMIKGTASELGIDTTFVMPQIESTYAGTTEKLNMEVLV